VSLLPAAWLRRIWRGTLRPDAHLSRAGVIRAVRGPDTEVRRWLDAPERRRLQRTYPWGGTYYVWGEVCAELQPARQVQQRRERHARAAAKIRKRVAS
jgi:hypothetical protein